MDFLTADNTEADGERWQTTVGQLTLIDAARIFLRDKPQLVRREALHAANRFSRLIGNLTIAEINQEQIDAFREKAMRCGFSRVTIRTTLGDIRGIIIHLLGEDANPQKYPRVIDIAPLGEATDDGKEMSVCKFAEYYTASREITRREFVYSANRFTRLLGPMRVNAVTTDVLCEYRDEMRKRKLQPSTIESSVSDMRTLVKAATGNLIDVGRRLHKPRPEPCPVTLHPLRACWPNLDEWVQQWTVISYWTALRLSDALSLQFTLTETVPERLTWKASKTGHVQRWPIPQWLKPWLIRRSMPIARVSDFSRRLLRLRIIDACERAEVPPWKPKSLRQYSLTQWMRASPAAGAVVHGCGLNGVLKHYVDPLSLLEDATDKLFVPQFFQIGDVKEPTEKNDLNADDLLNRMDPAVRSAMLKTLQSLTRPDSDLNRPR